MSTWTPDRWQQIQSVLDTFDDLPQGEREGFLAATRREDPELAQDVDELLAQDDHLEGFLERPVFPICTEQLDDALLIPRVGPYKLTRELGEGGMGTVYLATREEPYRQQVALKLIRREMLNPATIERFHQERQILAGIQHPNVAQIFDGGTTPSGQPYFAMEHVQGEPIEQYCRGHALPLDERLKLFLQICSAVQLAHQKLRVVHRDLKPSNILVTAAGVPKLLDFGIAKGLEPRAAIAPAALEGEAALSVLTPYYSSPEQLAGKPPTTASDVYSLGVLLYRILTGRLPFDFDTTEPASVLETISTKEPVKPSRARLQGDAEDEQKALGRNLSGDVDAIVLKALAHDPEERYSSVEQLAEDLRRYLDGLPVVARRSTWLYRTGKFLRRNQLRLLAAAAVVALGGGLIVEQAREIAQVRRVSTSLLGLLKALQPTTIDQRVEIEAALQQATLLVDDPMFAGHPLDRATLMDALGRAFTSLELFDRAKLLLEEALAERRRVLGEDHELVAESLNNLAFLLRRMGDTLEAEDNLRRSLDIRYQSTERDIDELAHSMNNLATIHADRGEYALAGALYRRVLEMWSEVHGRDHPDVVSTRNNLAGVLVNNGRYEEAEIAYRENLAIRERLYGRDHVDVAKSRNQLATVLWARGKLDEAEQEAREALRIRLEIFGADHSGVARVLNNLGMILQAKGALGEARDAYLRAFEIFTAQLGKDHLNSAVVQRNLASVLTTLGDLDSARQQIALALGTFRAKEDTPSWRIADAESVEAGLLITEGRFAAAELPLLQSYDVLRNARSERAPQTRDAAKRLIDLYEAWGKPEKAETYRRVINIGEDDEKEARPHGAEPVKR